MNLSPRQLFDPRLPAHVGRLLEFHGVDPGRLAFEITETVVVENYSVAAQRIASLKELGCTVGLDDFGTGYSSLASLRHLPVDFLKIDRSLVADTDVDTQAARIVQAVGSLAGALGVCAVAEGVERETQRDALIAAGTGTAQYGPIPGPAGAGASEEGEPGELPRPAPLADQPDVGARWFGHFVHPATSDLRTLPIQVLVQQPRISCTIVV